MMRAGLLALCTAASVALVLSGAAPAAAQDADGDLPMDSVDNCVLVANANGFAAVGVCDSQEDDDADDFGNACDSDLDQDGIGGFGNDFTLLFAAFFEFTPANGADLDCDGQVLASDVGTMLRRGLGTPPGP